MKRIRSVGFPITDKENERRRAILPADLALVEGEGEFVVQTGYGADLGAPDADYAAAGARIGSLEDALACDLVVDPKVGDAGYLGSLPEGAAVFGWVHATQNRGITDALLAAGATAFAWEKMYDRGRHVFWRNNELAGEAAVMHAFQCLGMMPYEARVAVVGRGNTARGAMRALSMLGADVRCYDRRTEGLLRDELGEYDAVVNCVLWDLSRGDHIISRADLAKMRGRPGEDEARLHDRRRQLRQGRRGRDERAHHHRGAHLRGGRGPALRRRPHPGALLQDVHEGQLQDHEALPGRVPERRLLRGAAGQPDHRRGQDCR